MARRYNKEGSAGLGDRRSENPGAKPLLSPQPETQSGEALQGPPPNGRWWNSRTVADWIGEGIARPVVLQGMGLPPTDGSKIGDCGDSQRIRPPHGLPDPSHSKIVQFRVESLRG